VNAILRSQLVIGLLAALAVGACANSRRAKSSETHFLALCADDACGAGLSCVCGVCSQPCMDDEACTELGEGAECTASAASCDQPRVCDAECQRDADCARLSDAHSCEAGRCRAPLATAGPGGGCDVDGRHYAEGERFQASCNTCTCLVGEPVCTRQACPTASCDYAGATYEDGARFPASDGCNQCSCEAGSIFCTEEGCNTCADGECAHGETCLANGASAPGLGDIWCNTCTCRDGLLGCTQIACFPQMFDTPPCEPFSCEYYGVCYPPGTGTEDGCCGCATEAQQQAGAGSGCIQPSSCPGRPDIGSRCGQQTMGCAAGLVCRIELFGERPICTRNCNYGCPTGTECVEEVPLFDGGVIERLCLRPCETVADCTFADGSGAASECVMVPGLAPLSYCF